VGAQNGDYVDIMFFDGVSQTVRASDLVRIMDALNNMKIESNWKKRGRYYPCVIIGKDKNDRPIVQYTQDRVKETIDLDQLRVRP
jgi:hypothetical protein